MELVCNFAWLTVAIVLWGSWFARGRRATRGSLLPAIAVQLIALFALTAILLPAISITDDLQASNNPAEVERSTAKRNQFLSSCHAPHGAPGTIALMVQSLRPLLQCTLAILPTDFAAHAQGSTHVLVRWSRPPPVA
jgi:hypothetical protein